MTSTGLASMTQLPPSPEMKGLGALLPPMGNFSLDDSVPISYPSQRLRSIARYETFQPRALACSPPVPGTYNGVETAASQSPDKSSTGRQLQPIDKTMTSLGAVAGSHGVAVFRLTQPHVPILLLSHATTKSDAVTSLAFSPTSTSVVNASSTTDSMHLAAARGSGVLVWDVSGHTLSPLTGRVSAGGTSDSDNARITSLAWRPSTDGAPWLAATTSSSACLWDLREPAGYTMFKPSLRFGVPRKSLAGGGGALLSAYVQVACSDRDEQCALLDASGTLRIFDTRMTDRTTRMSAGAVASFSSFAHAGVGLAHMPTNKDDSNRWVTWGLESPTSNAVVKVWESCDESLEAPVIEDDYWLMDGSPDRPPLPLQPFGYRLAGKCVTHNLACARVCPSPVENSIVTIGIDMQEPGGPTGWRADLWQLDQSDGSNYSSLMKVVSFNGGAETDKHLASMLGPDSRQGLLRGSELALSSYPTVFQQHPTANNAKGLVKGESTSEFGLLLCNLSENGYVTTHVISEALPHDLANEDDRVLPSVGEGTRAATSSQARVFPAENDVAIKDAARIWGSARGEKYSADIREQQEKSDPQVALDGGMPFDMDVSIAYSISTGGIAGVQLGGLNDSKSMPTIGASHSEDTETGADVRAAVVLMENIDADRIPCPRLCGATFGCGVGGLVTFHNGDVGKMWQWYQRTGSNRLSAVPGAIGQPSVPAAGITDTEVGPVSPDGVSGQQLAPSRTCPRSLQDLIDMTSSAKEAQWGDQEHGSEGGSSAGIRVPGDNFFEDDSDSSSELPEDDSEDMGDTAAESKNTKALYDSYFGASGETDLNGDGSERKSGDRKASHPVVGPSSDMLTPVVRVSHEFDRLALNNQSLELAKAWKLGEWAASEVFDDNILGEQVSGAMMDHSERPSRGKQVSAVVESLSPSRRALTSYRALAVPSPAGLKPVRVGSDPLPKTIPFNIPQIPQRSIEGDEAGVHGGEYSIRPNMQESMVFLRKLFTHQHDGSQREVPLDSPMLPNSLSAVSKRANSLESSLLRNKSRHSKRNLAEHRRLGVYLLQAENPSAKSKEAHELAATKEACLHNANVCKRLNETEKGEVWELLAQTVTSRLSEMGDSFGGWGGAGGGALGAGLVDSFLRFYESLGDVQMLSTMVCVLRGTHGKAQTTGNSGWSLLPTGQEEKYDTYIRRYADLLYGWGALTTRAELNKHLIRALPQTEAGQAALGGESEEGRRSPGIALVFTCPKCGNEAEFGTNVCRSCQDYAFRCGLCDNAVRGLFTVCESCGHGGHVGHMKSWFESSTQCPSGCGCNCTFAVSAPQATKDFSVQSQGTVSLSGAGRSTSPYIFTG